MRKALRAVQFPIVVAVEVEHMNADLFGPCPEGESCARRNCQCHGTSWAGLSELPARDMAEGAIIAHREVSARHDANPGRAFRAFVRVR